jgi:hypothetical protein
LKNWVAEGVTSDVNDFNVQANLPETSPFFVCPNGSGEHLFSQMFIVLGMYNFALCTTDATMA